MLYVLEKNSALKRASVPVAVLIVTSCVTLSAMSRPGASPCAATSGGMKAEWRSLKYFVRNGTEASVYFYDHTGCASGSTRLPVLSHTTSIYGRRLRSIIRRAVASKEA